MVAHWRQNLVLFFIIFFFFKFSIQLRKYVFIYFYFKRATRPIDAIAKKKKKKKKNTSWPSDAIDHNPFRPQSNPSWRLVRETQIEDPELKDDVKLYFQHNLSQSEIFDLLKVHYPMYAWSLRTLSRRLQHFGVKFINYAGSKCPAAGQGLK